jgi:hypothetical protein
MTETKKDTKPTEPICKKFIDVSMPDVIKTFASDTDNSSSEAIDGYANGGYMLTINSIKSQLYNIHTPIGLYIGIGDPFLNKEYQEFLSELPCDLIRKLKEYIKQCKFSPSNALLFSVKNTLRLVPDKQGVLYLYYPDNSMDVMSFNSIAKENALDKHHFKMGKKINDWLYKQFKFVTKMV